MAMIFGTHERNTIEQFLKVLERAEGGALMADGHLGYIMPVGGVAVYDNQVSVCGVGYDIGCGNKATRLDLRADEIREGLDRILDDIQNQISFGMGRANKEEVGHPLLDANNSEWDAYESKKVKEQLRQIAQSQLGTVGSGNHYVDIFEDEEGYVWIGVHFGSRGLGHKTATGFLNLAVNGDWEEKAPEQEVLLDLSTDLGERYFTAMQLCGRYAYAGRDWVVDKVASIIGAVPVDTVHNHHNYAWQEEHNGVERVVVRKGATPAFPGQRGFVGGSMGDNAVIVEGVESESSGVAFYSTVHGAGRIMGRREAAGRFKWKKVEGHDRKQLVQTAPGKISKDMMYEWLAAKGVKLRGGGTDESPHVYRRLDDVLKEQGDTIRVLHTLKPLGVVMAGENEFDPYKD